MLGILEKKLASECQEYQNNWKWEYEIRNLNEICNSKIRYPFSAIWYSKSPCRRDRKSFMICPFEYTPYSCVLWNNPYGPRDQVELALEASKTALLTCN